MGSLYLTFQLRRSALDIGVADVLIFDMPVELVIALMAVIPSPIDYNSCAH